MTIDKYIRLNDIENVSNAEIVEFGTAGWRLVEEDNFHAWACEHCGQIGGRGWEEPRHKYCSSCGFKMIRKE